MKKINLNLIKLAMSKFATGVTVVTINKNDKYLGKTVNSFAALSLSPPLVLFSLDKKSTSLIDYIKTTFVGINILSNKQQNLSNYFSIKKPKWENIKYFLTNDNTPMIKDSVVNLNCKKIKIITQGDHVIFICKIIKININIKLKPLIYLNSKYF